MSNSRNRLSTWSLVLFVLALIQLLLGFILVLSPFGAVYAIHEYTGYANFLVGIVVAWFASRYSKAVSAQGGNAKGLFYHALSLPILSVVQIGLAETGLKWIHVVIGIAYFVAVVGMYTLTRARRLKNKEQNA